MSESRYNSSESRTNYSGMYSDSSESRKSSESRQNGYSDESRTNILKNNKKSEETSEIVDVIDTLIDMYKAGKISGNNLADSLKKLNES